MWEAFRASFHCHISMQLFQGIRCLSQLFFSYFQNMPLQQQQHSTVLMEQGVLRMEYSRSIPLYLEMLRQILWNALCLKMTLHFWKSYPYLCLNFTWDTHVWNIQRDGITQYFSLPATTTVFLKLAASEAKSVKQGNHPTRFWKTLEKHMFLTNLWHFSKLTKRWQSTRKLSARQLMRAHTGCTPAMSKPLHCWAEIMHFWKSINGLFWYWNHL